MILQHYEDYWFDEFFGFWISDPSLDFKQSFTRNLEVGLGQNLLFDFFLKYFFLIFGYYPEYGRFLTAAISCSSIPLVAILSYKIDKSKSYLLTTFLIAHCWYLISYSQEVRGYSFGFMLNDKSNNIYRYNKK